MTPTSVEQREPAIWLVWPLVAVAIFLEQLADRPADISLALPLVAAAGWTAWAAGLRSLARRATRAGPPRRVPWRLAAIALAAFVPPVVIAGWSVAVVPADCPGSAATSPEGMLLACFRGLLLMLLAVGLSPSETRFAASTSLFLVAVSLIVVEHPASRAGVVAYAMLGAAWLAATRRAASSGRRSEPTGLMAAVAVAAVVAGIGQADGRSARIVAGFFPLSGGDGWAFPWARGGSGDGEDLVAAREKPTATGPVDSDIFVTSHKPSLYDLWTDLYGEPEKPKPDRSPKRAFGLGPDEQIAAESHLPDSERAGREFATARRGGSRRRPAGDLPARALVAVSGPAPVHLRLEVFHEFDGRTWRTATAGPRATAKPGLTHAGDSWMRWHAVGRAEDEHEVTVGTLATPVLPLVAHTSGMRIDRVDRTDFYRELYPGLVTIDMTEVPTGTRIETRSCSGGVDAAGAAGLSNDAPPATAAAGNPDWVADVAQAWGLAAGGPTWDQAAAVVAALARHCTLDPAATAAPGTPDTLEHFLCDSRRGPDYCFAGAAVLLLRELGFDARLAGGLYLSGQRRDPKSRRLLAGGDDAHFWAEVRDTSGRWVPIEATPGHALRAPATPWWQPVRTLLVDLGARATKQPLASAGMAAVLIGAWLLGLRCWRPAADALLTAAWRFAVGARDADPVAATWRLLESRAWLAGLPRPGTATARDWYLERMRPGDQTTAHLAAFITTFERAVYGPKQAAVTDPSARAVSLDVARHVTLRALRGEPLPRPRQAPLPAPLSLSEARA